MVGAEAALLALAVCDLVVELVDQAEAGLDRSSPRLGQTEAGEQLAATDTEEVGDGAGLAVGEQDRVHALLQARAVPHQMQPPARTLTLSAHEWVGQPDRRHQIATCELGQHPGIDPVGLAGQRRQTLDLLRIGDLDLPAGQLEGCTNRAPFIDSIGRGPACRATRSLRRCSPSASGGVAPRSTVAPSPSSKWKSRRLRLRSNPAYNIATGLPSSVEDARSIAPREALLHGIPYHRRTPAQLSRIRRSHLSRRRLRVRVPSLPFEKTLQIERFCL
jgi:hypothetical protein